MESKRHPLNKLKPSDNRLFDDQLFGSDAIKEINLYGINVPC